jgi:hypothetical protein
MGRLALRALQVFGAYAAVPATVVAAGFLYQAVGLWATILWGCVVVTAVVAYAKRRLATE